MTPDQLRALADALRPMAKAPCFDGIDIERAADYLRAQADAQPVAWRTFDGEGNYDYRAHELNEDYADEWNRRNPNHVGWVETLYTHPAPAEPAVPDGWKLVPVEPTPEMLHAEVHGSDWNGRSGDERARAVWAAVLAAAPAAPQVESKRDWSIIDAAICEYLDNYEQFGENDAGADACYTPTERERYLIYDAINGLLADESFVAAISAPQAEPKREPLSDEQITKGEYVLATKFSDGDPGDHWGVGFYDRFENGRHYVIDIAGKQIRGNGFRRAGRITADVGRWLLSAAKSLEASPPGTVNLWTMLTERAHGIGGSDAE